MKKPMKKSIYHIHHKQWMFLMLDSGCPLVKVPDLELPMQQILPESELEPIDLT